MQVKSNLSNEKTKISGGKINNLTCPFCGRCNFYAHWPSPGKGWCNHANCQGHDGVNLWEHFNISVDIEKEYSGDPKNPNRPVVEWLVKVRGIPRKIAENSGGQYRKVSIDGHRNLGMVAFPLTTDSDNKNAGNNFNCRLLNPQPGVSKAYFYPGSSWKGWWHIYPGIEHDYNQTCYITESVIDSHSLQAAGVQNISVLSANAQPEDHKHLKKYTKIALAPDYDAAGIKFAIRWKIAFPDAVVFLPPPGKDWNDLLREVGIDNWPGFFEKNNPLFGHYGVLALALTGKAYALESYNYHGRPAGIFTHLGCTWYSTLKTRGDEKDVHVERCGKFTVKVICYLKVKDQGRPGYEFLYSLEVTPQGKRAIRVVATGRDISTKRALTEFLLSSCKVAFEAASPAVTALSVELANSKAPEAQQTDFVGYDPETKAYVFRDWAIDQGGKLHLPDKNGLFKLGPNAWVTASLHSSENAIKPAVNGPDLKKIYSLGVAAWPNKFAVAFAWLAGSFFVNQIKDIIGFYPHLSLKGAPSSGKSELGILLNAMQGVVGEGFNIGSKSSTAKGASRNLTQRSGMFVGLREGNERNEKAFDWGLVLTAFNGHDGISSALKSNDKRTNFFLILSTMLFIQNTESFQGQAEKQRVISLDYEYSDLSEKTKVPFEQLSAIAKNQLARVIVSILQDREYFQANWIKAYKQALSTLKTIEQIRIRQVSAIVLAFSTLLNRRYKLNTDITEYIKSVGKMKEVTSSVRDFSVADHFFETVLTLPPEKTKHCLQTNSRKGEIYIHMPDMELAIRHGGAQLPLTPALIDALQNHQSFVRTGFGVRYEGDTETGADGRKKKKKSWVFRDEDVFEAGTQRTQTDE